MIRTWIPGAQAAFGNAAAWGGVAPADGDILIIGSPDNDPAVPGQGQPVFPTGTLDSFVAFGPVPLPVASQTVFFSTPGQIQVIAGQTYSYGGTAYSLSFPVPLDPTAYTGNVVASGTLYFGTGNGSLTGAALENSSFGQASVIDINGASSWQAYFDNTLAGTIAVGGPVTLGGAAVGQPAADQHGATSELDIYVYGYGSVQNGGSAASLVLSSTYVPTTANTGTINVATGSEVRIETRSGAEQAGESADATIRYLLFPGEAEFDNEGLITVAPGGALAVYEGGNSNSFALSQFVNNGAVVIQGAAGLSTIGFLQGNLSGRGSITVDGGNATDPSTTLLHLNAIVNTNIVVRDATVQATDTGADGTDSSDGAAQNRAIGGTFTFADGHGRLLVDPNAAALYAGTTPYLSIAGSPYATPSLDFWNMTVNGFQAGDTIEANIQAPLASSPDSYAIAPLAWDAATDTLSILELDTRSFPSQQTATITVGQFHFAGTYGLSDFSETVSQGTNGYLAQVAITTDIVACFLRGTRIATPGGAVAVEALREGDAVLTRTGAAPVRWVGWREIDCTRHPRPLDVLPVRIDANAFAPGRPSHALRLSPDHAVFVGGVLIPVRYLVNGATIVQEAARSASYWHVELPRHDIVFAEGLACESYLDTGNRHAFSNGGDAVMLHPDFAPAAFAWQVWQAEACAELVLAGAEVQAVRTRLLARAAALGHAMTRDPGLRLFAGRRAIAAERGPEGWMLSADLPRGARRVRLLSRRFVPVWVRPDNDDCRTLGVAVRRVWLDEVEIGRDDLRLDAGWHAPEAEWRWTDGAAGIAVGAARRLRVELAEAGMYWAEREPTAAVRGRRSARADASTADFSALSGLAPTE